MRWERLDWGNKRYFVYESKSPKGRSPSAALYNYDVLIDFPDREFTIGRPGQPEIQRREASVVSARRLPGPGT